MYTEELQAQCQVQAEANAQQQETNHLFLEQGAVLTITSLIALLQGVEERSPDFFSVRKPM